MAISTFWWCLAIKGGMFILGIILWCYGLLIIALTCILRSADVICGNWEVSDLVIFYGFF